MIRTVRTVAREIHSLDFNRPPQGEQIDQLRPVGFAEHPVEQRIPTTVVRRPFEFPSCPVGEDPATPPLTDCDSDGVEAKEHT
ncbi:hypothetical protein K8P10_002026 [Leucobacter sp. Psy1]|nr:hypothetical protein K8P10_002026 [Leucobacter sp. Psy1]